MKSFELLAPAGDLDSAYAAFHYGADAIYLGLKRFSARAGAANFDLQELSEILAFAHAATPRRAVYVALNTLIRDAEVDEVVETLAAVTALGVDAVIVQDLGVLGLARRHFPRLALHASTQMAIHNLDGALAAKALGVSRVTLARELTLAEIRSIAAGSGIEVETFVHGALCYSYSGLCLYSSMLRGRSGNRGECTYPCREAFTGAEPSSRSFPFSMKDLALPEAVQDLRAAGVMSFKIEGRKKNAIYVATTTEYYRRVLDGHMTSDERATAVENIQTVFSRPWTSLYVASRRNRDVIDTEVVGHRGAWIGTVGRVTVRGREGWLRFRTRRRLERHDGLQIDIQGDDRPFGFPVDHLRLVDASGRSEEVFEAPANANVEVSLPPDHPSIASQARIYCSSSQKVKQRYRFPRPKPGAFRVRQPLSVVLAIRSGSVAADAVCGQGPDAVRAHAEVDGVFTPSRNRQAVEDAAREAFGKLGDTAFSLGHLELENPAGLFVPVSLLNRLRRDVLGRLAEAVHAAHRERVDAIRREEAPRADPTAPGALRWAMKTDRLVHLQDLEAEDWAAMDEVVIDIARDTLADLLAVVPACAGRIGHERVRLALPSLAREWDVSALREKVRALTGAGCLRWEAANLFAWTTLDRDSASGAGGPGRSLATDWSVYVTNRLAARQVMAMGADRFALSPDDDFSNLQGLVREFGARATVIVYQDTPLFISENCALASLGRCGQCTSPCPDSGVELTSDTGERIEIVQERCRTVVINTKPLNLSDRLDDLTRAGAVHVRADFIHHAYRPEQVRGIWRALRCGGRSPAAARR
jgi:putative protease